MRKGVRAPFLALALCLCFRKDEIELITWIDLLSSGQNGYTERFFVVTKAGICQTASVAKQYAVLYLLEYQK